MKCHKQHLNHILWLQSRRNGNTTQVYMNSHELQTTYLIADTHYSSLYESNYLLDFLQHTVRHFQQSYGTHPLRNS
jgi:hypothetical protein